MKVGRGPLGDHALLGAAAEGVEGKGEQAWPLGVEHGGEETERADEEQRARPFPQPREGTVPGCAQQFSSDLDRHQDQADDRAAVAVGPQQHQRRQAPQGADAPVPLAAMAVEQVGPHRGQQQGDHVRARGPDAPRADGGPENDGGAPKGPVAPRRLGVPQHKERGQRRQCGDGEAQGRKAGQAIEAMHGELRQPALVDPGRAGGGVRIDVLPEDGPCLPLDGAAA